MPATPGCEFRSNLSLIRWLGLLRLPKINTYVPSSTKRCAVASPIKHGFTVNKDIRDRHHPHPIGTRKWMDVVMVSQRTRNLLTQFEQARKTSRSTQPGMNSY